MARIRNLVAVLLWFPPVVACASVLDIETAKHNSSLDTQGGGSLCDRYCNAVQTSCTDASGFQQYKSMELCLKICGQLDPGSESDDSGNTVGCRLHYANSAGVGGELESNCPAAGPGGNGVCGTNCEGLCKVDLTSCTANNATYDSQQTCLTACNAVPDLAQPTDGGKPIVYNTSITGGYSVQCRLYHLGAAQTDPALHCQHVDGRGGICAPP